MEQKGFRELRASYSYFINKMVYISLLTIKTK